jgi:hypothetical protein
MPAVILPLLIQYGLPQVISLVQMWTKHEPDNVQASEWLALLKTLKPYSDYVPPADPIV